MRRRVFAACLASLFSFADPAGAGEPLPPPKPVLDTAAPLVPSTRAWSGFVELGLNGAEGNSENFKLHLGAGAKRKTDRHLFVSEFHYWSASSNGKQSENRALLNVRSEWPVLAPRFSWFVSGSGEYDKFKAFDVRLALHTGVGYEFIDTEAMTLKGRAGAGSSREFGGPNDHWVPELLFGGDFEWRISERQKLTATIEYFPAVDDFGDFRLHSKACWECLIDPEWNLTLKIGAMDRYDSTPEGRQPNDLEYFAVLIWKF